ncbi:adenylosuccinate synthetase [Kocuria rhizophila]|nr:adenylosuccinate synthetase [Kocuria rhizophila]
MGERCAPRAGVGVNTGRPRRTGWYDAVMARQAARSTASRTCSSPELDMLTGWRDVRVRRLRGGQLTLDEMPMTQSDFHHAKPV